MSEILGPNGQPAQPDMERVEFCGVKLDLFLKPGQMPGFSPQAFEIVKQLASLPMTVGQTIGSNGTRVKELARVCSMTAGIFEPLMQWTMMLMQQLNATSRQVEQNRKEIAQLKKALEGADGPLN